jgi:hypothetical protein
MAEYIEREALLEEINEKIFDIDFNSPYQDEVGIMVSGMARIRDSVEGAPAADVAPVVRCKDCIHYEMRSKESGYCYFWDHEQGMEPNRVVYDDFCSYGERNGGEG